MLKHKITYKDYDDNEVTEVLYFNLTQPELMEMAVSTDGGFEKYLERIIETQDAKSLIETFKKLLLLAYGQKSEDGKRFVKTDQLREEFSQSAAYEAIFMQLAGDAVVGAEFIKGMLPKELVANADPT